LTSDILDSKLELYPDIKELLQAKGKERLQALESMKNNKDVKVETPKVCSSHQALNKILIDE
jgi:hypothetical protein